MLSRTYVVILLILAILLSCYIFLYTKVDNVNWIATLQNSSIYQVRNGMRSNILAKFSLNVNENNSQALLETIPHPPERNETTYKEVHNTKCYIRCVEPMGRLGNQMFQFASTLGIADTLDCKPIISQSHPLLKFFNIKPTYISGIKLANMFEIKEVQWKNGSWRKQGLYRNHNLTIVGYLQSWKYFTKKSGLVREIFTVKPLYIEKAELFLKSKISTSNSRTLIGIHVRRGDLTFPSAKKSGRIVATRTYLESAMEFFRKRFTNYHFIVCSDDMGWCQKNIKGPNVTFSTFREPIVDMAILSMCNHTIITAGTFGWWGGWLAGGIVVYLSDYPIPGTNLDKVLPKQSYYPPKWIGINNEGLIANATI